MMIKMKEKTIISWMAIAVMITLLATSCSKNDKDGAPALPPIESFQMDFSDFKEFPDTTLKSLSAYEHFTYSYVTVGVWNVITTIALAVPVAVYLESFNHTPEFLGDDTWQWTYSVDTYTARLLATRTSNEKFTAEMFVSKTGAGAFEDFKWFEGNIRYDHTHASWQLYESPDNNVQWLDIEWTKDWDAGTSQITYTNVKAGTKEFGGYITYGITDDADYDAFYTLYSVEQEVNIKFNTETKAGRVKAPAYFEDGDWHCWNEQFQDTDCGQ
jgi:hypothetical protein